MCSIRKRHIPKGEEKPVYKSITKTQSSREKIAVSADKKERKGWV
jgi:hypothetical protein